MTRRPPGSLVAALLFAFAAGSVPALAAGQTPDRPWSKSVDTTDQLTSVEKRFAPPAGFARVPTTPDSAGAFLRGLPLRSDRTQVYAFDGSKIDAPAAAVVHIDVGNRNLQQCADAAIRLHAEWMWASGKSESVAYHFTSGDLVSFADWVKGVRWKIAGSKVERVKGKPRSSGYASFRRYLDLIFMYAGTRSLRRDAKPVPVGEEAPGDVFVDPGSPGHALVILDVAVSKEGRRVALLGQSFMPAQEIHVLESDDALGKVWFELPKTGGALSNPSWRPFPADSVVRFK